MSIEQRLRDALEQKASEVEPTPGALFEIQRRLRNEPPPKPVLLRPAFVMAGVAFAILAATLLIVATGRQPSDTTLVAPPTSSTAPEAADSPLAREESAAEPQMPETPEMPSQVPETDDVSPNEPEENEGPAQGETEPPAETPTTMSAAPPVTATPPEIATATTPADAADDPPTSTTALDTSRVFTPPTLPQTAGTETSRGGRASQEDDRASQGNTVPADAPLVPERPPCEGSGVAEDAEDESTLTLYFSCDSRTVSLERRTPSPSLQTAVDAYLAGPTFEEAKAGFSGPGEDLNSLLRAQVSQTNRRVTVDFQSDPDLEDANLNLLVKQLNSTLFEFSDDFVLEYRIEESCADFFALLGRSCEMHTSDRAFVSTLAASPIGANESPSVYTLATADSESLGALPENSRLTPRRASNSEGDWAEVVTPDGILGWVNTRGLTAQPLEMTPELLAELESLARGITSAPGVNVSELVSDGLVVRWGSNSEDMVVIPPEGGSVEFWNLIRDDLGRPRPSSLMSGSLGSLLWIGGKDELAVTSFNTPGGLGKPHEQFSGLYYISIYHPNVLEQVLPDPITGPVGTPDPSEDETGFNLPPPIELPKPKPSHRARISVMFDFLRSDSPKIYGVEAVWSSLQ